jgi:hypothetical protein
MDHSRSDSAIYTAQSVIVNIQLVSTLEGQNILLIWAASQNFTGQGIKTVYRGSIAQFCFRVSATTFLTGSLPQYCLQGKCRKLAYRVSANTRTRSLPQCSILPQYCLQCSVALFSMATPKQHFRRKYCFLPVLVQFSELF